MTPFVINSQFVRLDLKNGEEWSIKLVFPLYIQQGQLENFSYFLVEGKYLVALWAAHIIIEYGNPDKQLNTDCLNTIIEYSDNPLSVKVSNEEKIWLKENKNNDV